MKYQSSIFRQLLNLLERDEFQRFVDKYQGDYKTSKLKCWGQFVSIFYSVLRQRSSLRDIENGMLLQGNKLYHLGTKAVKKSTLSDANNKRNYRIYEESFNYLLSKCKTLSRGLIKFENPIKSIDSTIINVCYSLYPWARYQVRKGAIKLHMMLEHDNYLPEFLALTDGNTNDRKFVKKIEIKADSIYVFDMGYTDYGWYKEIDAKKATFVTRARKETRCKIIGQHQVNVGGDVLKDEDIAFTDSKSKKKYSKPLRLITYVDPKTDKIYRFITNNSTFSAETIVTIYKQRWKIELFFRWIKQNLKIKSFLGTSKNAVMTQIWIAMIAYLILWYIKLQTRYRFSLARLAKTINETLFDRVSLIHILNIKDRKVLFFEQTTQLSFGFT